jgi:RNA polymerase sigma factor (sigma-70 family)
LAEGDVREQQKGWKKPHLAKSIGILPNCIPTFSQGRVSNIHKRFMLTEQELVKGCAKGDRAAQRALYERYCGKMMVICQRYARSTHEAEDSLQEGFIKIFKAIAEFRFESRLETWITRIMINTSLNSQRQKLYMLPMIDVEDVSIPEREEISLAGFHLAELIAMVQSLPDGCRVVFNLFAIEGYSHKEIATMLSVSEGTSKSQYNRARTLLRAKLEAEKKYAKLGEATI